MSKIRDTGRYLVAEHSDFDQRCVTIFDYLRLSGYQVVSLLDGWDKTISHTAKQDYKSNYFALKWGQVLNPEDRFLSTTSLRDKTIEQVLRFAKGQGPFCIFVRSLLTHFKSKYNGAFSNANEIVRAAQLGRHRELFYRIVDSFKEIEVEYIVPLIATLDELDILDETIIIIHSDHGDMLWNFEEDLVDSTDMHTWGHGIEPYNALLRVPLIIRGLGLQGSWPQTFRLVDIVPTLLDALSIPYNPGQLDGFSLELTNAERPLYGDSAGWGDKGLAFSDGEGEKLICSERLHAVSYALPFDGYERLSLRNSAPREELELLRKFLDHNMKGQLSEASVSTYEEAQLAERLRALGYLD